MTSNLGNPNRKIYDEFQRVVASNRFIFTQGAITVGVFVVFGLIGMIAYMGLWGVLLMLSLSFERPYRLLRAILPEGNWPAQIIPVSTRWRVSSIVGAVALLLASGASLWLTYSVVLPLLSTKVDDQFSDSCIGLICLILK